MKTLQKLKQMVYNIKSAYKYIKDPQVSIWNKFLVAFPLLYIISPIDLLGDYLLGIGWIDDTLVALVVWSYVLKKLGKNKQDDNYKESDYDFTDDEYDIE